MCYESQDRDLALEDAILKLTHQLKRPLIMVQGILSNMRDIYGLIPQHIMNDHIESGIIVSRHAELLCKGVSKVLAAEAGGKVEYEPVVIDVRWELQKLWKAMKRASGRVDLSFSYYGASPTLKMDRDSFLYVFYVLIDNAIKYADPHTTVSLVCAEERARLEYALKVKSVGLPIPPYEEHLVFEKFGRCTGARRYDETGIGIGCWAARKLMRLHGGDIALKVANKLSVFIVYPPKHK